MISRKRCIGNQKVNRRITAMRKPFSNLLTVFILLALLLFSQSTVLANSAPIANTNTQSGSLTLQLLDHKDQVVLHGGSVRLYKVADFRLEKGKPIYTPSGVFSELSLPEDVLSPNFAANLQAFTAKNNVVAKNQGSFDGEGKVYFANLPAGLYLLVHEQIDPHWYPFNPFLISLPAQEIPSSQDWQWEITAKPKINPKPPTPPRTPPTTYEPGFTYPVTSQVTPSTSYVPGAAPSASQPNVPEPTKPLDKPKLPFTGLHRLPILILSILGVLSYGLGAYLRKR